jgi:hypothetical protein
MSVGAARLPYHSSKINPVDLGKSIFSHDYIELNFTESVSDSFRAIRNRNGPAAKFFEQAFHDQPRDRMVFTNEHVQWPEKGPF